MELKRTGEKINNNSITRGTLFRHKEAFKTNLFSNFTRNKVNWSFKFSRYLSGFEYFYYSIL